jgi:hypothetical protein
MLVDGYGYGDCSLSENSSGGNASAQPVAGYDDVSIALELNDVNTQPCMGDLIRMIQRMNILFGKKWEVPLQHLFCIIVFNIYMSLFVCLFACLSMHRTMV